MDFRKIPEFSLVIRNIPGDECCRFCGTYCMHTKIVNTTHDGFSSRDFHLQALHNCTRDLFFESRLRKMQKNFSDEPQTGLLDNPSNLVKNGHKSASIIMIIIGNESSLNPRNVVHSRNRSYTNELTIFLRKKKRILNAFLLLFVHKVQE